MTSNKKRGDFGEEYTVRRLLSGGYRILARNYRKRTGEIDVVAEKSGTLVFVEVKTRRLCSIATGAEAVSLAKQKKIIRTAEIYLRENSAYADVNTRFDVADIVITNSDTPDILEYNYYENAFTV
ncbi:UPF0102 protein [Clostridia bacterium]|nr:UPF0102 protein [Clostridia bacterium]